MTGDARVPRSGSIGFGPGSVRVAARNFLVWRSYAWASAAGNFGEPLLYLLALGWGLGRIVPNLGGMTYAEFIAPGLVVSTAMYTATFECTFGSYTRLDAQRTYDAILATPVTVSQLVTGEILWGGMKATFGASIVLVVIASFGLVPSPLAVLVVPVAFLAGLAFAASALVVTALSRSYEFFNYYFVLVIAPMFLFSGIFFPLDQMPAWVGLLAQALPLTHVVETSRALVRGTATAHTALHLAAIPLFLAPAYGACLVLVRRRLVR